MNMIQQERNDVKGDYLLDEIMPEDLEQPLVYAEDRDTSWRKFMEDIEAAKSRIHIDMPDVIEDNDDSIAELVKLLEKRVMMDYRYVSDFPEK